MKKLYTLLLATLFSTVIFAGDILFLNDSVSYEGKVKSITNCNIEFKFNGNLYLVPTNQFAMVKLEKSTGKLYRKYTKLLAAGDTIRIVDEETCIKAQEDAQELHYTSKNKFLNVLYGMVLPGGSQILGAIYIKPKFNDASYMHLSNNKELHTNEGYLQCYLKRAKSERMAMRTIGSGVTLLLALFAITFA